MITTVFLAAGILLAQVAAAPPTFTQPLFDTDAARTAERAGSTPFASREGEAVNVDTSPKAWKPVTDEMVRKNSGYTAPPEYRYHLSAVADLDSDGQNDTAEFVDNGSQGAIRIRFGGGSTRILSTGRRRIYGEGLFAAGRSAIMINYPESSVVFLFMRGKQIRAIFEGE